MGTWSPLGGEKMALIGQIRNRGALCGVLTPRPRAGCRAPAPGTCCSGRASLGLGLLNGLLGFGAVSWGLGMAPNPGCAFSCGGEWENPDRSHNSAWDGCRRRTGAEALLYPSPPLALLLASLPPLFYLHPKQPPTDLSQHSFLPSLNVTLKTCFTVCRLEQ